MTKWWLSHRCIKKYIIIKSDLEREKVENKIPKRIYTGSAWRWRKNSQLYDNRAWNRINEKKITKITRWKKILNSKTNRNTGKIEFSTSWIIFYIHKTLSVQRSSCTNKWEKKIDSNTETNVTVPIVTASFRFYQLKHKQYFIQFLFSDTDILQENSKKVNNSFFLFVCLFDDHYILQHIMFIQYITGIA